MIEWEKFGRINIPAFFLRRTVRIIPPMLICIAITVLLIQLGLIRRRINLGWIHLDLLFLTNYASQIARHSNLPMPLWSLDVEEHFYLLFPFLFIATRIRSLKSTRNVIAFLICAVLGLRVILASTLQDTGDIYFWSHTRVDSILYGCLLAVWNNPVSSDEPVIGKQAFWFVIGTGLMLVTLIVRDEFLRQTIRYSIQGIGLFLIFNFILRSDGIVSRMLSIGPLKVVADYSYVLYLIHGPMLRMAKAQLSAIPLPIAYAIGFVLAFAFAAAMHRVVEKPLMQWRRSYQARLSLPSQALPKGVE